MSGKSDPNVTTDHLTYEQPVQTRAGLKTQKTFFKKIKLIKYLKCLITEGKFRQLGKSLGIEVTSIYTKTKTREESRQLIIRENKMLSKRKKQSYCILQGSVMKGICSSLTK